MTQPQVVILGAGPVGLMLACQLQVRGVSFRLLEARPSREYWVKALGVSPRTLEVFDQMGILDEALDRGLFLTAVNTLVEGTLQARVEIDPLALPYATLALGQYDTETILEDELRRCGGLVEWQTRAVRIEPGAEGVEIELEGPSGREVVFCHWLVGCDGAHSLSRKAAGVSFEGGRYEQQFLLGDVEIGWDHPHSEVWKLIQLSPEGELRNVVVAVPIPGTPRRYRLSLAVPPDCVGHEDHLELLRAYASPSLPPGTTIEKLRWSSFYRISHRLASRYRQGRVLLAGDAAHLHPPIGGLGMNTGLQDAYNLGWKLAAVAQGRVAESLLDTYHEERHPVGAEVVALTSGRMDDFYKGKPRDEAEEERANTQLEVNYCAGPLSKGAVPPGDRGALPGQRVDAIGGLERRFVRRRARLIELLRRGEFHLVGYGGNWSGLQNLASMLKSRLPFSLRIWAVGEPDAPDQEDLSFLYDAEGEAAAAWGPGPGAILVRPDGYVAWRGGFRPDGSLEQLLQQLGSSR